MYSAAVLDHFKNPRNAGELEGASASIEVENPVCGDVLRLTAIVQDGVFAEVRFKAQGCVAALACASALTEILAGKTLDECRGVSASEISERLGELPQASLHAAQLAAEALALLLRNAHGSK